jgi:hypothetical protein
MWGRAEKKVKQLFDPAAANMLMTEVTCTVFVMAIINRNGGAAKDTVRRGGSFSNSAFACNFDERKSNSSRLCICLWAECESKQQLCLWRNELLRQCVVTLRGSGRCTVGVRGCSIHPAAHTPSSEFHLLGPLKALRRVWVHAVHLWPSEFGVVFYGKGMGHLISPWDKHLVVHICA